jgi:magnesium chelatase family protein
VRAAAVNAGLPLTSRKLTINLSPASLPKHGSGFDLAIAMAAFAADDRLPVDSVAGVVHLGELGLDGRVRPVAGVLPAVLAAVRAGFDTVVVPAGSAPEARLVPGVRVIGVASLRDAAIFHGADLEPVEVEALVPVPVAVPPEPAGDLADVIGNDEAVEAMQVAAAGGHHVYLLGPPGAGKTMLAARLPTLLPDLTPSQSMEVSSIRSLAGIPLGARAVTRPPLESPHHTASAAAIVGGGSGLMRRRGRRTGCCSSTRRRSSAASPSTPCGSRSSRARSPSRGRAVRRGSRRGSSWCWLRTRAPAATPVFPARSARAVLTCAAATSPG